MLLQIISNIRNQNSSLFQSGVVLFETRDLSKCCLHWKKTYVLAFSFILCWNRKKKRKEKRNLQCLKIDKNEDLHLTKTNVMLYFCLYWIIWDSVKGLKCLTFVAARGRECLASWFWKIFAYSDVLFSVNILTLKRLFWMCCVAVAVETNGCAWKMPSVSTIVLNVLYFILHCRTKALFYVNVDCSRLSKLIVKNENNT